MQIVKDHIPGFPQVPYATGKPTMIVLHETANPTATIDNEVAYVKRNWQNANFHYIVDANKAVEVTNPDYMGGGAGPNANPYAIHIELVRNTDFQKAYNNWLDLAKQLADRYGIPKVFGRANGIVTHHWVSLNLGGTDHTDPDVWLAANGISIDQLSLDINKRGEYMVKDVPKLDAIFQGLMGRSSTKEEQDYWIGKRTYDELIDVIVNQQGFKDTLRRSVLGKTAEDGNWQGRLTALEKENTELKAAAVYEPLSEPVYKKKAS